MNHEVGISHIRDVRAGRDKRGGFVIYALYIHPINSTVWGGIYIQCEAVIGVAGEIAVLASVYLKLGFLGFDNRVRADSVIATVDNPDIPTSLFHIAGAVI